MKTSQTAKTGKTGGRTMACCRGAPFAECLCGGRACAQCSVFLKEGVVYLTLGGDGRQSMGFLAPTVARMFGARSFEILGGRRIRMVGCKGTAHELRSRWRGGVPAQLPLNFGELGAVAVDDVGTPTCASSQICDFKHIPCASCYGHGAAIVRPCGHSVCVVCAFESLSAGLTCVATACMWISGSCSPSAG